MDAFSLIISLIAAAAAVGATAWARTSARASQRSAAAAERSARAEERAAEAAQQQLQLESERIARERRRHQDDEAPMLAVASLDGINEFVLTANVLRGRLRNTGMSAALIERVTLECLGETAEGEIVGTTLPARVRDDFTADVQFQLGDQILGVIAQASEPLRVAVGYAAENSPWRGQASWRLLRTGADAAGNSQWRTDGLRNDRID